MPRDRRVRRQKLAGDYSPKEGESKRTESCSNEYRMADFQVSTQVEAPTLFAQHPNFSDAINRNIIQSEIEGGVDLRHISPGTVLEVQTRNHVYRIVNEQDGEAWISGHPVFCPDPVLVDIHGSTWGGSMIRERYIGRGMHLEFGHPDYCRITTSRILEVQQKN